MSTQINVKLSDLYSAKVDEETINYILNHFDDINTPIYYEQIIPQIPVKPLGVLGVFGVQATVSAILLLKQFGNSIKYVATKSTTFLATFKLLKLVILFYPKSKIFLWRLVFNRGFPYVNAN